MFHMYSVGSSKISILLIFACQCAACGYEIWNLYALFYKREISYHTKPIPKVYELVCDFSWVRVQLSLIH